MQPGSRKMDCENVWSDRKNESLNSTTSKTVQQRSPYICNSSCISPNTNPAFYNVPHYGSPEFPCYNNYLEPYPSNINSYNSCYNHLGNAMGPGNFQPFLGAQPCNAAMERKNCSQSNHLQHKGTHPQGRIVRSNRKNIQYKKKQLNSERSNSDFSCRPQLMMNYINTGNKNHHKVFDNTESIYNAVPESQLLSTGLRGNGNNILLNECSSNEANLHYSIASENQTNSTNCYLEQSTTQVKSGTNRDFEGGASTYPQKENITNFANEYSSASSKFNIFDDVLTKSTKDVDTMQPLDTAAQLPPDASNKTWLPNEQNTTNLVLHNNVAGEEKTFTLETICEGQDENGKQVILLLAAPEIQQQIAQWNAPVDGTVEAEGVQAGQNVSTSGGAGTINENGLLFEQSNTVENCQEVQNLQNDSIATFTSSTAEYFGHEEVVETSKRNKRRRRTASSHTQTRCKKVNRRNAEDETTVLEESGQSNLNDAHPCQPRSRRASCNPQRWRARLKWKSNGASFKSLQNQYFRQFARKYFNEKNINDKELQRLMTTMLNRIGGSVMLSIWCSFETLTRNYNARRQQLSML